MFNFAVEKRLMAESPAKDRWLKQSFGKPEHKSKDQFTIKELNRLSHAPLYTGCIDDERGYAKPGPQKPRRGRFWIPLLSLFHGLRLNEACQLHVADVKERDGIPYLAIREADEEGEKNDKHLKTSRSERDVPIHPEILSMGFLAFVKQRRKANDSPRLFPELPSGAKGYYSHVFSKWFPRFVENALGIESKATFHSLRHAFRDATRAARLPPESVALLGGWQGGEGNPGLVMNNYGRGSEFFRVLAEDMAKVTYPELNLSHLHSEKAPRARERSR
jgi:integrase